MHTERRGNVNGMSRRGLVKTTGVITAAVAAGRTGMRRTLPHGQHSSGCGHWSSRAQEAQRTVTQASFQLRWATRTAGAPRSSGGAVGSPHGQG